MDKVLLSGSLGECWCAEQGAEPMENEPVTTQFKDYITMNVTEAKLPLHVIELATFNDWAIVLFQ